MIQSVLINKLLDRYHEKKLAHAFLLETNNLQLCYKDVIELVKNINCSHEFTDKCIQNCNICSLIVKNEFPGLIVIEPEGQFIKKDQILNMMSSFKSKPIYSDYNVYIVNNADRLNSSSANTILKFLEEPEDGIIGFFITNNKENVISTVRSRCQVLSVRYDDLGNNINEEFLDEVKIYLINIYNSSDDLLYNKTNMVGLYSERKDWEIFFSTMLLYIRECCYYNRVDKIDVINNLSEKNISKIIVLIENILKYIKSNFNIELILDKFVIEMRKYYE